ncbi:MAG: hypothetical protein WBP41_16440, partial [Saprospiraceae bacterium]
FIARFARNKISSSRHSLEHARTSVNRRPTFAFFIARCARNKNYNCLAFKTVVETRFTVGEL